MKEVLKKLEYFYSFPVYKSHYAYDFWADIDKYEDSKYRWGISSYSELEHSEINTYLDDFTKKMENFLNVMA